MATVLRIDAASQPEPDASFSDHPVTEPTDDRRPGATTASDPASGRPTNRLPNRELVRISLYWLGLSSIFAGISFIMRQPLEFLVSSTRPGPDATLFLVRSAAP